MRFTLCSYSIVDHLYTSSLDFKNCSGKKTLTSQLLRHAHYIYTLHTYVYTHTHLNCLYIEIIMNDCNIMKLIKCGCARTGIHDKYSSTYLH